MKSPALFLSVLLFLLTPTLLPAAGKGKAKGGNAKKGDAKAAMATPAPVDNPVGNALGNFDFDTIKAMTIDYNSSGGVVMNGSVMIRSDQMNLDCAHLVKDKDSPIMDATGDPVKIHQKTSETDELNAECQHLVYDTDKKIFHLIGKPVIFQKKGDSVTMTVADEVTIVQGANGQNNVQLQSHGGGPVEITNMNKANKTQDKSTAKPATKVKKDNVGMISLPNLSKGSASAE